jgi:putative DNA primase/helicase
MRSAVPGSHDYLVRKGLAEVQGLVLPEGGLMVPMRSMDGNRLQGAQIIQWLPDELKWEKKMIPGMKAKGAILRLGKPSSETIFCEGYATGLSIELAARSVGLRASVLVCFSDSNMVHVVAMTKGARRYVFADNDKSEAGERAAKLAGLPYCMSPVVGEDANDMHVRAGLMTVAQKLMEVRRAVPSG